jgi:FMN phosphatase YigB (HAD superfamily)
MLAGIFAHLRERFEFWTHSDGIVVSGMVKLVKPKAAILEHLLMKAVVFAVLLILF